MKPRADKISFLAVNQEVEFEGGRLTPVSNLEVLIAQVKTCTNPDGFIYPPYTRTYRERFELTPTGIEVTERSPVPGSERPALLFRLPASHTLSVDAPVSKKPFRDGDGGFLLNLIAYLFGVRLQFHDWFFDRRVPVKLGKTTDFDILPATPERFLSQAYKTWKAWPDEVKKRFTNVLYMSCRSPCYEWDWERFVIDYMVFDGMYKIAFILRKVPCCGHRARLDNMCDAFDIPKGADHLDNIYNLRNELFHETLWAGTQPGRGIDEEKLRSAWNLRWLNLRLIAAMLGYDCPYVHSPWWTVSRMSF